MIRTLLVSSLALLAPVSFADTVYKTVDEQGNVQYSADPPPQGVNYEILDGVPEPDEAAVREAEERQEKLEEHLDDVGGSTGQQPDENGATIDNTDSAAVMADWRERKNEERQRSFWGEKWPIHHPRDR